MNESEILKKIKKIKWDNRVQRQGFLQSKSIISRAEVLPIRLAGDIFVKYDNVLWVNNSNLYDYNKTKSFSKLFEKAFNKNRNWPLKIISYFDDVSIDIDRFVSEMRRPRKKKTSSEDMLKFFDLYQNLLFKIQKYYQVAVPLTNHCEDVLRTKNKGLLKYAFPYKELDVDKMHRSLIKIQESKSNKKRFNKLLQNHLEKYAWIKASYNIINSYTREDVLKEISTDLVRIKKLKPPNEDFVYLLNGLQIGIYLRNRMKELSQKVWYHFDGLANLMAKELLLKKDEFFMLTPDEVKLSFKKDKCIISKKEFAKRKKGFIVGIINNKDFLISGEKANSFDRYINNLYKKEDLDKITGAVACKGRVKGKVRIISNHKEFNKLKEGDILVTSMTTPDYVIIMKKASAIITDEGGLSCHASIVSRELNIPCVTGTKIATKVLKDGDIVEVDAEQGIIKKINK